MRLKISQKVRLKTIDEKRSYLRKKGKWIFE